jgi:hypothetical protein
MATLLLGALGASIGGAFGATAAILGQAAGALAGNILDTAVLTPRKHVTGPRLSTMTPITGEEGAPVPRVHGTMRIAGTLIWMTRFLETSATERAGGKALGGTRVTSHHYSCSLAFGLCEGPVAGLRRIWADGQELDQKDMNFRFHAGTDDQFPDPLIEAKQGAGNAPAYRGLAYVVIENLPLESFGNRIPQMQFEVMRPVGMLERQLRAVTLIPGATEFGYEPAPLSRAAAPGETAYINRNVLHAPSDWTAAIDELQALCPALQRVAIVSSWFGDDLRAGSCKITPGVTDASSGGHQRAWSAGGVSRAQAREVTKHDGGPAFGGTPDDASLIHAIIDLKARGLAVTLYPFIMMDVPAGNALPAPDGAGTQPAYPWRGRVTCHPAPGVAGSPDGTNTAQAQVAAFLGAAQNAHFSTSGGAAVYAGPATDWGYRRFILHHAALAAAAGGVDAFLVGSEMPGLTAVRGASGTNPFVAGLMTLAGDVRAMLGTATKLTYAADWSEFWGFKPAGVSSGLIHHLDPLWAHPDIDAIGIDWYQPLTDWRDADHQGGSPDGAASQHDRAAMLEAIASGENHDWFYASDADRLARVRTPITDGSVGKPWVWRSKDLHSWWTQLHFDRPAGTELFEPTAWVPQSKPFWFTEFGCPAVDKGANEPNVFPDPKSSEARMPRFSNGGRDDLQQRNYLEAILKRFDPAVGGFNESHNPISPVYGGRMVDPARLYAWAYDARPFPAFPNETSIWSDGGNWRTGHWLNGRLGSVTASDLLRELTSAAGLASTPADAAQGLMLGHVSSGPQSAKNALEDLFDLFSLGWRDGPSGPEIIDLNRAISIDTVIADPVLKADAPMLRHDREATQSQATDMVLYHADPLAAHENASARARAADADGASLITMSPPVALDADTAQALVANRLATRRANRETLRIELPYAHADLLPGDVFALQSRPDEAWRITRLTQGATIAVEAVRAMSRPLRVGNSSKRGRKAPASPAAAIGKSQTVLLDLPGAVRRNGVEVPVVRIGARAKPWRKQIVRLIETEGSTVLTRLDRPATIGRLHTALQPGAPDRRMPQSFIVNLTGGALFSVTSDALLAGSNLAAVRAVNGGWEMLQFENAEEIAPGRHLLTKLLRGRMGTADRAAEGAAVDAEFVLIDDAVAAISFDTGFTSGRSMRVSKAGAGAGDDSEQTLATGPLTRSIAPFAPARMKAVKSGGDWVISWIRCSRINGEDWEPETPPLGEAAEAYDVEFFNAAQISVRKIRTLVPEFLYTQVQRIADLGSGSATFEVVVQQVGQLPAIGIPAKISVA